jgi:hypothetical protein
MTEILRVYDPAECDERGVPLGWEKCDCIGCSPGGCAGSLKAAALVAMTPKWDWAASKPIPVRCEDCGHPMRAGTWEGGTFDPQNPRIDGPGTLAWAFEHLLHCGEPPAALSGELASGATFDIHYSPCDEGCDGHRLDGPGRWREGAWAQNHAVPPSLRTMVAFSGIIEAAWRPVEVRTLGWPHDLRPEKLAVLCLRCFAGRGR